MAANHEGRAIGMVPGGDLHRELVVVAHPDRNRDEQVREIELVRLETLHEGRPAADERWGGGIDALLLEEAHFVRDQQRRRIRDREVSYTNHGIESLFGPRVPPRQRAAERGERARLEQRAPADTGAENGTETRIVIQGQTRIWHAVGDVRVVWHQRHEWVGRPCVAAAVAGTPINVHQRAWFGMFFVSPFRHCPSPIG